MGGRAGTLGCAGVSRLREMPESVRVLVVAGILVGVPVGRER